MLGLGIAHGAPVSSYLLVSRTWLLVATPLLYKTVILRTAAQASALERVLKAHPEIGALVLQLRVEGGFGNAMHAIFKCTTRLQDIVVSLLLSEPDNVSGLCSGLALVNPRSFWLVDQRVNEERMRNSGGRPSFARNKKVEQLAKTILELIPNG